MKHIRTRLALLVFLIVTTIALQYALSNSDRILSMYIRGIFLPLQALRSRMLNAFSLSAGDILYLLLALLWLLIGIRLVYFLCTLRKNKEDFRLELIRFLTLPAVIYPLFILLWGGNYSRKPLAAGWNLQQLHWDTPALLSLNMELVRKMNAERSRPITFPDLKTLNSKANNYYHQRYGEQLPVFKVKPTSLGYMLNYLGIHGYYNPLSGEAQFNRFIPPFMHPFVISHEMAHQAGIAAEDDANLLAYVIGSGSEDPAFRYSAYFNIFLYAFADLKEKDAPSAQAVLAQLNPQSREDMRVLKRMYRKYRSRFRRITNSLYDEYLRLHGQQDGINTYNEVTRWVYYLEHMPKEKADLEVCP